MRHRGYHCHCFQFLCWAPTCAACLPICIGNCPTSQNQDALEWLGTLSGWPQCQETFILDGEPLFINIPDKQQEQRAAE